jgi:hypothetical protein
LSKRLIVLLASALAMAIVAAGCGSSSDDDSGTTDATVSVTKEQLIKQGDTICKQGNEEIEEGFARFMKDNNVPQGKEPSDEQGVEIVETVIVPNLETQSELIRGIGIPEGDEEQVEAMLDSLDEGIETAENDPEALFKEDTDPFADANAKAQEYGFTECGEG